MGGETIKVTDFTVELVNHNAIRSFVRKHHYSGSTRGLHISYCFGLYSPDGPFGLPRMIGVMIYGEPAMPDVSKKYCPDNPDIVIELNRLCCIDDTPKNTESYFIGKTLRWLKNNTKYRVIISFADPNQGHEGTIYKATNFKHYGMTEKARSVMIDGKRLHERMLTKKCPKGDEIRRRIKNGGAGIEITKLPPKHIYVKSLDRRINFES
tara:strand:- start:934 stop:1560 length:627 start_codon:yes stop_codon:yes gene_type:complete